MSEMKARQAKITVAPDGPYIVRGGVRLDEKIIRPEGAGYKFDQGRTFEQKNTYYLCRCGHSGNAPFCDGSHAKVDFEGTETASKEEYAQRARIYEGEKIDIADDERCAFARFCHAATLEGEASDAWKLAMNAHTEEEIAHAETVAGQCPAGRLSVKTHEGDFIEPELEPGVSIMQDPEKGVSAGIYVHGNIELEGSDGELYETRNRYALCRCGSSREKPFCDAFHIPAKYNDGHLPASQSDREN